MDRWSLSDTSVTTSPRDDRWPYGFLLRSIAKATSFWVAYVCLLTDQVWEIIVGVGAVAFVTGPSWHAWIAAIIRKLDRQEHQ